MLQDGDYSIEFISKITKLQACYRGNKQRHELFASLAREIKQLKSVIQAQQQQITNLKLLNTRYPVLSTHLPDDALLDSQMAALGLDGCQVPNRPTAFNESLLWTPNYCFGVSPELVKSSSESDLTPLGSVRHIWAPEMNPFSIRKAASNVSLGTFQSRNVVNSEEAVIFHDLVDKILKNNDQPASIILQQRLKFNDFTTNQLIFDAIVPEILGLIQNRFGNFLVQCMLECCKITLNSGSSEQMDKLAQLIAGHVVHLACDRFGCHVIQKVPSSLNLGYRKI